ncbi:MAG TPA: GldG family protein, partial [Polyangiaceae bacterium]
MSPEGPGRRPRAGQVVQLAGVVAAVVLAFVVNMLADRHFTRWDWTQDKRWSLSPATLETLHSLEQPVEVWAITGSGDSLQQSIKELLASYQAASSRIEVHFIDPDRDVAQLVALQARFGLEAGRTDDGRVATDAVIVVATGDKHWFLTPQDLFEQADDVHVKPREERALTRAIRSVLGGEKARLCFTAGHGELSLEPDHDDREGLGALRDLFEKNNYELTTVDLTVPGAHEPFAGCAVAIIAGMRAPFAPEEANRLRTWLMLGGSLLAAVGPLDPTGATMPPAGLDEALAPFGIALDDDVVQDLEPSVSIPDTHGQGFFVAARPHPVTTTLVAGGPESHPPRVAVLYARSLRHMASPGAAPAAELLFTSNDAFAKRDVAAAGQGADAPPRSPSDAPGPFVLAMASERPRVTPDAPHGPRVVVLGSRYFLAQDNWRQPRPLHGAAFL